MATRTFHWADYLVFILSLVMTAGIGLIFLILDWKKKQTTSTDNFLLAGKSMHFFPVALSMLASILNGVFILGGGAEMHYYGTQYALLPLGLILGSIPAAVVFAPTFHRMELTSAYEYMEKRFHLVVRIISSLIFIISVVLFLAVVLYVPALAFSTVTGLKFWITIVITGLTCTLYCGVGGMKAVIWTDTVQVLILVAGMALVGIVGLYKGEGSPKDAWDINNDKGRIIFDKFDPDPRERHTFWGMIIGQAVNYGCLFISNQMVVQRYLTVPDVKQAVMSLLTAVFLSIVVTALIVIIGIGMFAYYTCDPLITFDVTKGDQIVALFVMDTIGHLHGLPGLFTAAVFAAALSSVSSALNSLAAVFLEDFFRPAYKGITHKDLKPVAASWISRLTVVFFGLVTIGLSYLAEKMGETLITVTPTIWSISNGPLAGLFVLGFFCSFANAIGATVGVLCGLGFGVWITVCNVLYIPTAIPLPLSMKTCNMSDLVAFGAYRAANPSIPMPEGGIYELYKVNYTWYALICFLMTIVIGMVVSLLTCGIAQSEDVDSSLMYWAPCCRHKCYRCNVQTQDTSRITPAMTNSNYELDKYDEAMNNGIDNPAMEKERF